MFFVHSACMHTNKPGTKTLSNVQESTLGENVKKLQSNLKVIAQNFSELASLLDERIQIIFDLGI